MPVLNILFCLTTFGDMASKGVRAITYQDTPGKTRVMVLANRSNANWLYRMMYGG